MRTLFCLAALAALCFRAGPAWADQDADTLAEGKQVFLFNCSVCHALNDPYEGCPIDKRSQLPPAGNSLVEEPKAIRVEFTCPNLCGVYGSPAGRRSKEGYSHSAAFQAAAPRLVWTEENLDKWLTDAQSFIPGAAMYLRLPDPEQRKLLINFLKTYKEKK
jgi:cytochrome c2